jgi:hypothetical protein
MKITIEMENLNKIVEDAIAKNTDNTIQEYVAEKTKSILDAQYKETIEELVNNAVKQSINQYIDNYSITVGNPFTGEQTRTFTPREYINHTIAEIFEKKLFTEVTSSYYGGKDTKTITFEEYIKKSFDFNAEIKKHMDSFSTSLKREVKANLENAYNRATRDALSDVVMDTIMENEKFKNISNNIKRLGE